MISAVLLAAVTGFANLPQLVAAHPLAPVLAQYDREIEALRSTEHVAGLTTIARQVGDDARTIHAQTSNAGASLRGFQRTLGNAYQNQEATLLSRFANNETTSSSAYRATAQGAAQATLRNYRAAMAQRTARATAARRQQLNEAESTLAFDLEKGDSGRRLLLALKLRDLHLDAGTRSRLSSQLHALDAREETAIDALRTKDAAALGAYAAQMHAQEVGDDARMATDLSRKTAANIVAGQAPSQVDGAQALRDYHFSTDASDIQSGLRSADDDLTQRFSQLQLVDRSSRESTDARLAQIEGSRRTLYDAIVAQITANARAVARNRHITSLRVGSVPPKNAIDLTSAVRTKLRT
jgi:hypothetical protein